MSGHLSVIFVTKPFEDKTTYVITSTFTPKTNLSNVPIVEKDFVNPEHCKSTKSFTWKMPHIRAPLAEKALTKGLT